MFSALITICWETLLGDLLENLLGDLLGDLLETYWETHWEPVTRANCSQARLGR